MRKAVDYLRAHPIIAVALVVGVVGVLLLWPRPEPTSAPAPQPAPAPAPEAAPPSPPAVATPAGGPPPGEPGAAPSPAPTPRRVAAAVDAGRPDPFQPLVVQASGAPGVPVPPPAPLPPPLFPGQGQPGQPAEPPPPPPKAASRAEVIGVMGDNGGVAVVRLDGQTYVVSRGDVILDKIRVMRIDAARGVVVLEEDGEQFERVIEGRSS
ncbi:MAG: hypothetical protein QN174_12355 [Armatimonadota bacterium]|nr:hypothetical protein [Armatimonadota bacterium]MDR7423093.1 hypothetical protein [Armatimonadota bacterium]MDR7454808.1 hypothetical protein [Armatimonadota bacterium]MDR7457513.1 hypothetical protein [Armatimonadota bacterium]MDR7497735.1 hypothetical protein [Armatimonadota bacterium]